MTMIHVTGTDQALTHTAARIVTGNCPNPQCGAALAVFNNYGLWPPAECSCGWSGGTGALLNHARIEKLDQIERQARALAGREAGGADLVGLLVGLAVAFVFALVLTLAGTAPRHAVTIDTTSPAVTPSPTAPAAPPAPLAAPLVDPGPARPASATTPARGALAPALPTTTTTVPAPAGQVVCDVLADGIDTTAGNGAAGWYRAGAPADVAAANADRFRNCHPEPAQ